MQFLIKNSNIILNNNIQKLDLLTLNDKIVEIGENLTSKTAITINCKNLFLFPGLTDMHVHLRDPGFCQKETIKTGSLAAAAGGFSTVCCMPNTNPVIDCENVVNYIKQKSVDCPAEIQIIAAITKNLAGTELVNFEKLAKLGVIAFSDDGFCLNNDVLMAQALKRTSNCNRFIISHCEDCVMSKGGLLNEGEISKKLNLKGINNLSESSIVTRHIELAKQLDCKIHIAHVSTKESVAAIKKAKQQHVKVSAETCPHYFSLNEKEVLSLNANCKINPPLRSETDQKAIINAVVDGTIDCIATDHAPHTQQEKQNFQTAPSGSIGLETALGCTLTQFYHTKKLSLLKIVELMAKKPCEILNLKFNDIKKGAVANFSIVDINKKWIVDPKKFKSKSENSAFIGKTLTGKVLKTFFKGNLVFDDQP